MSDVMNCGHRTLRFAHGDYYLICSDCLCYWTMCDPVTGDTPAPHKANQGTNSQLSGEVRSRLPLSDPIEQPK